MAKKLRYQEEQISELKYHVAIKRLKQIEEWEKKIKEGMETEARKLKSSSGTMKVPNINIGSRMR